MSRKPGPGALARTVLLLFGALLAAGCVDPVPENERSCPCASGWTCCEEVQVCVAEASRCEGLRPAWKRPGAPTGIIAERGDKQARVTWKAPASDGGLAIQRYVVTAQPGGVRVETPGPVLSTSVGGLTNGQSTTFTVRAVNAAGEGTESEPSAPVVPLGPPGAPTAVSTTPGLRSVHVSWSAPEDTGGVPLRGYTVAARPSGVSVDVGPDVHEATLLSVPSTREQTLSVTARNAVGAGVAATSAPVRTRPEPVELTSLRMEAASETSGCLSVAYELRQLDGERVEVRVEVDADGDGTFQRATQAGSLTHSGLVALATSVEGTAHAFHWNRARDVPGATPSADVRVTVSLRDSAPVTRTLPISLPAATRRCEWDFDSSVAQRVPDASSTVPVAFTQGDFDRDGKQDLVVLHREPGASLLRGRGNGGFAAPVLLPHALSGETLVSADLDRDGALDLVVLNPVDGVTLQVALGHGDGSFAEPVETSLAPPGTDYVATSLPVLHDLDEDGAPELAVSHGGFLYVLRHTAGGSMTLAFTPPFVPYGPVVAGDFDGDGLEDLMVAGATLHGFYGRGLLAFTHTYIGPIMGGSLSSVVAADFDDDALLDLAVATMGPTDIESFVLLGYRDGYFGAPRRIHHHAKGPWEFDAWLALADLNGDGRQDLAYMHRNEEDVTALYSSGDATFTAQVLSVGRGHLDLKVADFDGSGAPDVALLSEARSVRVLRGVKGPQRADLGSVFATADFDGDGRDDVASLVGPTGLQVHLTRARGGLVGRGPSSVPPGTWKLLPGRFDVGPTVDLLALTSSGGTSPVRSLVLLRGNGDGTFAAAQPLTEGLAPRAVAAGDVDGDGALDVAFAHLDEVRLLLGQGDGTFIPGGVLPAHTSVETLALGDLNADGRADLLVPCPLSSGFELAVYEGHVDGTLRKVADFAPTRTACVPSRLLITALASEEAPRVFVSCAGGRGAVLPLSVSDAFTFHEGSEAPTPGTAAGLAASDLDGDGRKELLVASPDSHTACVLTFRAGPGFEPGACFGTRPGARDVAVLDVEHDGVPEVLVGGGASGPTLLRLR
ncbi:FG-GAP-like repeat-containing protein [Pyxidicoccus sp. 3LFB2]